MLLFGKNKLNSGGKKSGSRFFTADFSNHLVTTNCMNTIRMDLMAVMPLVFHSIKVNDIVIQPKIKKLAATLKRPNGIT